MAVPKCNVDQVVDRACEVSDGVVRRAREITDALQHRHKRLRTQPFIKVELDEEDSLITSIESMMASAAHKEE